MIRYALARTPWGSQHITALFDLYGIEARAMTFRRHGLYVIAVQFMNVSSRRENWAELLWAKLCINLRWMPFRLNNPKNVESAIKNPKMPRPHGRRGRPGFSSKGRRTWS